MKLREMYAKDGGAFPDAIKALTWGYSNPTNPAPEEVLREINGRAIADVMSPPNPKDPKAAPTVLVKAGDQLPGFAMLRDDGSTACGNWIYSGVWSQAGNNSARRDTSDPSGLGIYQNWGFSWPANRRILYNRAGASPEGKPWDAKRRGIAWNGTAWAGVDVPDIAPALGPDSGAGPFIMNPEGVARLFAVGLMNEGPFPEHYEPFETPVGTNLMCPTNAKAISNPAARVYKGDLEQFGKADGVPVRRHDLPPDRAPALLDQERAGQLPSCSHRSLWRSARTWPRRKASRTATWSRSAPTAARSRPGGGDQAHEGPGLQRQEGAHVGIPIHWGFIGVATTAT
jgi:hypothetical protein